MSNYKELRDELRKERKKLYNQIRVNDELLDKYKKVKNIVDDLNIEKDDFDYNSLFRLKKYFPDLEQEFNDYREILYYDDIIFKNNVLELDYDKYIKFLKHCSSNYGIPPYSTISEIQNTINTINKIKSGNSNGLSIEEMKTFLNTNGKGTHVLFAYSKAICHIFAGCLLSIIVNKLDYEKEHDDNKIDVESINNRINLINKYYSMFSDNELLIKFSDDTELEEFTTLIYSILDSSKCIEILNNIKLDQEKEEVIEIDFDNLDMSYFSEDEQEIIKQLREICEDEDFKSEENPFVNVNISYNDRLTAYKKVSIKCVLQDVNNLLNKIYDNKSDVIRIFELIIDMYQKYTIRTIREERIIELERIKNDFNNIISFINKTYVNREEAYDEEQKLKREILSIDSEFLPVIKELIDNDFYGDDFFDNELDSVILSYKTSIKMWKKRMTSYYQKESDVQDNKQNTDNLVFCLNIDIPLEKEGYQKELLNAIEALESKTSKELKMRPGRKGMSRIRKTMETDKSKDFVNYLETKLKKKIHFVPYRYSCDINRRTGLFKFSTSPKVKEFLEEKYGLSKQSAIYGIFDIISVYGKDHSEYHFFEDYILNNYLYIESIGEMLSSETPNYDKIANIIDGFLKIKEDLVKSANTNLKKS